MISQTLQKLSCWKQTDTLTHNTENNTTVFIAADGNQPDLKPALTQNTSNIPIKSRSAQLRRQWTTNMEQSASRS